MVSQCNEITPRSLSLLERPKEFQAKETHLAGRVLAQDLSHDGGSLARDKAGGGGRGGGNGEMDRLVGPENVR